MCSGRCRTVPGAGRGSSLSPGLRAGCGEGDRQRRRPGAIAPAVGVADERAGGPFEPRTGHRREAGDASLPDLGDQRTCALTRERHVGGVQKPVDGEPRGAGELGAALARRDAASGVEVLAEQGEERKLGGRCERLRGHLQPGTAEVGRELEADPIVCDTLDERGPDLSPGCRQAADPAALEERGAGLWRERARAGSLRVSARPRTGDAAVALAVVVDAKRRGSLWRAHRRLAASAEGGPRRPGGGIQKPLTFAEEPVVPLVIDLVGHLLGRVFGADPRGSRSQQPERVHHRGTVGSRQRAELDAGDPRPAPRGEAAGDLVGRHRVSEPFSSSHPSP